MNSDDVIRQVAEIDEKQVEEELRGIRRQPWWLVVVRDSEDNIIHAELTVQGWRELARRIFHRDGKWRLEFDELHMFSDGFAVYASARARTNGISAYGASSVPVNASFAAAKACTYAQRNALKSLLLFVAPEKVDAFINEVIAKHPDRLVEREIVEEMGGTEAQEETRPPTAIESLTEVPAQLTKALTAAGYKRDVVAKAVLRLMEEGVSADQVMKESVTIPGDEERERMIVWAAEKLRERGVQVTSSGDVFRILYKVGAKYREQPRRVTDWSLLDWRFVQWELLSAVSL